MRKHFCRFVLFGFLLGLYLPVAGADPAADKQSQKVEDKWKLEGKYGHALEGEGELDDPLDEDEPEINLPPLIDFENEKGSGLSEKRQKETAEELEKGPSTDLPDPSEKEEFTGKALGDGTETPSKTSPSEKSEGVHDDISVGDPRYQEATVIREEDAKDQPEDVIESNISVGDPKYQRATVIREPNPAGENEGKAKETGSLEEHWLAYYPDSKNPDMPDHLYATPLEGNRIRVKLLRSKSGDVTFEGTRSKNQWSGEYTFPDLESFKNNGWVDVETKAADASRIPERVYRQAFSKRPRILYRFQRSADGGWSGTKTGPGFRWSGDELTEYRMDTKRIILKRDMSNEQIEKWTRYRLEIVKRGALTDIWVVRVAYVEGTVSSSLLATRYPLVVLDKEDDGTWKWTLRAEDEEMIQESQADAMEDMIALAQRAKTLAGSDYFFEEELNAKIQDALNR